MRQQHQLTQEEIKEFKQLHPNSDVWRFWSRVAMARGLDYKTLLSIPYTHNFTGLPIGHEKHWCWPSPLNVTTKH